MEEVEGPMSINVQDIGSLFTQSKQRGYKNTDVRSDDAGMRWYIDIA